MALPLINVYAYTMGGIGPVETKDISALSKLSEKNGVPFYAGRFYPKNHDAKWQLFNLGFNSQTAPWMTWEDIGPTQIWMLPAFEDERILKLKVSIDRIDLWPERNSSENDLPPWEQTVWDDQMQQRIWGSPDLTLEGTTDLPGSGGCIDPGITITQNMTSSALTLGYVGIAELTGHFTEYAFYDQELQVLNGESYGQPQMRGQAWTYFNYYQPDETLNATEATEEQLVNYKEFWRIRSDGVWIRRNAEPPNKGKLEFKDTIGGLPENMEHWVVPLNTEYGEWLNTDIDVSTTFGNTKWDQHTKYIQQTKPPIAYSDPEATSMPGMGQMLTYKPSNLDTVVYTIKAAAEVLVVPDVMPGATRAWWKDVSQNAAETYGAYLASNIWYFYLPVRFNGSKMAERTEFLLNRAGIKRRDDPNYIAD